MAHNTPDSLSPSFEEAIVSRKSIRAFRDDPVLIEAIDKILELASKAPSAANMQPWRVYVLTGAARQRIVDAVCNAFDNEPEKHASEYEYYPAEFFEPYLSRRRNLGLEMYQLLGITRENKEGMRLQQRRNFEFFGAPVGLMFTFHRKLARGNLIDYGAFLQTLMIAARGFGLDTCVQGVWSDYHRVIARELQLAPEEMLLGGMALGYADASAGINRVDAKRAPVAEFARYLAD